MCPLHPSPAIGCQDNYESQYVVKLFQLTYNPVSPILSLQKNRLSGAYLTVGGRQQLFRILLEFGRQGVTEYWSGGVVE